MKEDQRRIKTGRTTARKKINKTLPQVTYLQAPRSITRGRYPLPVTVAYRSSLPVIL
jgi:hypothetical protein